MATEAKVKKYKVKSKNGLSFPNFHHNVTDTLLNGPNGAKVIRSLENYEKENQVKIFGVLITLE